MVSSIQVEPVSRTDQYKRVMKPLLERKRRARINRCLDELRELLVAALQAEGETVTRLEKADILEMTVRHVRKLNQRKRLDPRQDAAKFQQGFVAAAQQVQTFLMSTPSLEPALSSRLLSHLTTCASAITVPGHQPTPVSPIRPTAIVPPKLCTPVPSPPLIDLSIRPPPVATSTPQCFSPTPPGEPALLPQDLSMKRASLPMSSGTLSTAEGKDAWRPW